MATLPTKILIVDDEPNILVALDFLLKKNNCTVEKANNGVEALQKIADFLPKIVILDVMMPEMDGLEVARQIRANSDWSYIRIVFLTAKGTQYDKMMGYKNGAETYITKPFDNQQFIDVINELIEFD